MSATFFRTTPTPFKQMPNAAPILAASATPKCLPSHNLHLLLPSPASTKSPAASAAFESRRSGCGRP
uniref:Uncharacterized protein n=1 Tax=Rhizophora mucronata TaxID=61149 RepID=A0A2P2LSW8_RHIMU